MDRKGNIRITIFILICLFLAYSAVGYTYDLYTLDMNSLIVDNENVNVTFDGEDFSPIFKLMGYGINAFGAIVAFIVYVIVILVFSIILSVLYYFIGIKKIGGVSDRERYLTRRFFIVISIGSVIVGGIISRFSMILPLLIYSGIWTAFVFFLCVRVNCKYSHK